VTSIIRYNFTMRIVRDSRHIWSWLISPYVSWLVTHSIHTLSCLILSILIRNSCHPYSFVTYSIHTHSIHMCRDSQHTCHDSFPHLCSDSWLILSIPIRDSFYPYSFVTHFIHTHSIHMCRDSSHTCHDTHNKFVTHALTPSLTHALTPSLLTTSTRPNSRIS